MVGGEIFSAPQRPENLQNRSQPRHRLSFVIGRITARHPVSDVGDGLPSKGKGQLREVQAARPAAEAGGIGQTIRVFQIRQCLLPRAVLYKAPPQCLTARQQAVMRIRERKQRQESEGPSATRTATPTDLNPVMILIVGLLAAAAVADNRTMFTNGALWQDDLVAVSGPLGFELVRRARKWDKENRTPRGSAPALTRQDLSPEVEPLCPSSAPETVVRRREPRKGSRPVPPPEENPTGREYCFSPIALRDVIWIGRLRSASPK